MTKEDSFDVEQIQKFISSQPIGEFRFGKSLGFWIVDITWHDNSMHVHTLRTQDKSFSKAIAKLRKLVYKEQIKHTG